MGLFDRFTGKNKKEADRLSDVSFIQSVEHIEGPWHQYDFTLAARGYSWGYILDTAEYLIHTDLLNVGTVSLSPGIGEPDRECVREFRECGESFKAMPSLKDEGSALGIGGESRALGGMALKIVWFNQSNLIRLFIHLDDEDQLTRYAETVVRRTFGTDDAMKKAKPLPKGM